MNGPRHDSGPTPGFPFAWPNPADAGLHWVQRAVDARAPEAMPPLELDVRARWVRTFAGCVPLDTRSALPVYLAHRHAPSSCAAGTTGTTPLDLHAKWTIRRALKRVPHSSESARCWQIAAIAIWKR